jgi:hypothetical protein
VKQEGNARKEYPCLDQIDCLPDKTRQTLEELDLSRVADELNLHGLLGREGEMMINSNEAARLLCRVSYENRLTLGRMMMSRGNHKGRVASLHELHWLMMPSAKSLVALKLERVADWVQNAIGDKWLAGEIVQITAMEISYVEKCHLLYELLEQRIAGLEGIIKNSEEADHA